MAQLILDLTDDQLSRICVAVGRRDGLEKDATPDEVLMRVATYLQYIVQEQEMKQAMAQAQTLDLGLTTAVASKIMSATTMEVI